MPLYEYRCQKCDHLNEAFRSVENRDDKYPCDKCGGESRKIISLSAKAHGDLTPYYDDNLQTKIESKKHRQKVMKEQGVVEAYGKGWT